MPTKRYRNKNEYVDNLHIGGEGYLRGGYLTSRTVVRARKAEDIPLEPDGTVAYLIDGIVDISGREIVVPEGGLQLAGNGTTLSKLVSSANNYTMFKKNGTYSGDFFVGGVGLTIEVTGTNSKVYDLDNQENGNAVELRNVNFDNCTSLGTLKGYRQGLNTNVAWFNCADGITLDGTWSGGFRATTCITIALPASCTLFRAGGTLDIQGTFTSDINALSVNAATTIFGFSEGNFSSDRGFRLQNFRTTATNPLPNISSTSDKAHFTKCEGLKNTYPGGQWVLSSQSATALSGESPGTFLKLAGTTTYSGMAWLSGPTDNAFTQNVQEELDWQVLATISLSGTAGDQITLKVRKWDDSASSYVDIQTLPAVTMNAGGRAENIAFPSLVTCEENDRVELWVSNSAARDVTCLLNSSMQLIERPS